MNTGNAGFTGALTFLPKRAADQQIQVCTSPNSKTEQFRNAAPKALMVPNPSKSVNKAQRIR